MSTFTQFLQQGISHILNYKAIDHLCFLMVLGAANLPHNAKRMLGLITAFTLGHALSCTSILLQKPLLSSYYIELLIPITIIVSAAITIFIKKELKSIWLPFGLNILFGCVHGLGFSGGLSSLFGSSQNYTTLLIGFNLGAEIGQIIFLVAFYILSLIALKIVKVNQREWQVILSSIATGVALKVLLDNV
jgi:hypothetical protein